MPCKQSNVYLYGSGIAQAVRERFKVTAEFDKDSLWIMVSGRFAQAKGCVTDPRKPARLEALLQAVPDVERVLVNVMGADAQRALRGATRHGRQVTGSSSAWRRCGDRDRQADHSGNNGSRER